MAGKEFMVYSTNPKMDTSGVSAKQPRTGYETHLRVGYQHRR